MENTEPKRRAHTHILPADADDDDLAGDEDSAEEEDESDERVGELFAGVFGGLLILAARFFCGVDVAAGGVAGALLTLTDLVVLCVGVFFSPTRMCACIQTNEIKTMNNNANGKTSSFIMWD